jgi:hypothetical protein
VPLATTAYAASVAGTSAGTASMYSRKCSCASPPACEAGTTATATIGWTRKISGMIAIAATMLPVRAYSRISLRNTASIRRVLMSLTGSPPLRR